jgi:hypothetical protein
LTVGTNARSRIAIASAVALTSACSLLTSLSDLQSSIDASGGDATADAPPSDVSTDELHVADASADATTDASTFCVTNANHTFCEDFDEPNLALRWDGTIIKGDAATLFENDATSLSPPSSLSVSNTMVGSTAQTSEAYITKAFASTTHITLTFEFGIDTPSTCTYVRFADIEVTNPPAEYSTYNVFLGLANGVTGQVIFATTTDASTATSAPLNNSFNQSWQNIELDIDLLASTASVTIDGTIAVAATAMPPLGVPSALNVKLGIMAFNCPTESTFTAHYDNVLVDSDAGL